MGHLGGDIEQDAPKLLSVPQGTITSFVLPETSSSYFKKKKKEEKNLQLVAKELK